MRAFLRFRGTMMRYVKIARTVDQAYFIELLSDSSPGVSINLSGVYSGLCAVNLGGR